MKDLTKQTEYRGGYSLIETVTAITAVLVTLTLLIPAGRGLYAILKERECAGNRSRVEIRYEEYQDYREEGETFLAYVRRNVDKFDALCPSGGRYLILVTDEGTSNAAAHVFCTYHGEDYVRVEVPAFKSAGDALVFAGQIYELASLYMADLEGTYDTVTVDESLPFERVSLPSTGKAVEGAREFTGRSGAKTVRIDASGEFRKLLDYGTNDLAVGKIYFKKDAAGTPIPGIDYVAVRQGNYWAKFASDATECGEGPMIERVRPA